MDLKGTLASAIFQANETNHQQIKEQPFLIPFWQMKKPYIIFKPIDSSNSHETTASRTKTFRMSIRLLPRKKKIVVEKNQKQPNKQTPKLCAEVTIYCNVLWSFQAQCEIKIQSRNTVHSHYIQNNSYYLFPAFKRLN